MSNKKNKVVDNLYDVNKIITYQIKKVRETCGFFYLNKEDAMQIGYEAYLKAKKNATKPLTLKYVSIYIYCDILHENTAEKAYRDNNLELFETYDVEELPDYDKLNEHKHLFRVTSFFNILTDQEQCILYYRFLSEKPKTYRNIGQMFGITKQRANEIAHTAIAKLRKEYGRHS